MSNFKVGQKVVCVKAHSKGLVSVGSIYVVRGVMSNPCCGIAAIDVGIDGGGVILTKCVCGGVGLSSPDIYWISAIRFRPLIEDLTSELARKAEDSLVHERPERVNEPQVA